MSAFELMHGALSKLCSHNSSSSSSSSSGGILWGYLGDALGSCSSSLQAFNSKWPNVVLMVAYEQAPSVTAAGTTEAGSSQQQQQQVDVGQLYADALQLCRAVAAAAPLPRVCNHLGCENLARCSEAAAALKVCGGCGAHYCSAACQAADWRRHKRACRRMREAGSRCS
jgi:hypothetical protein